MVQATCKNLTSARFLTYVCQVITPAPATAPPPPGRADGATWLALWTGEAAASRADPSPFPARRQLGPVLMYLLIRPAVSDISSWVAAGRRVGPPLPPLENPQNEAKRFFVINKRSEKRTQNEPKRTQIEQTLHCVSLLDWWGPVKDEENEAKRSQRTPKTSSGNRGACSGRPSSLPASPTLRRAGCRSDCRRCPRGRRGFLLDGNHRAWT